LLNGRLAPVFFARKKLLFSAKHITAHDAVFFCYDVIAAGVLAMTGCWKFMGRTELQNKSILQGELL